MELSDAVFYILELLGTLAFAVSGAMLAIERRMDLFGVVFLGVITAVGGGLIRDLLIGLLPMMFTSVEYVIVAAAASIIVFITACKARDGYMANIRRIDCINNVADAIGLGVFSVTGTRIGMSAEESNAFMCVFLGVLTGIGGGLLRDTISRSVPIVLRKRIYALASIAGSIAYYLMIMLKCSNAIAAFSSVGIVCIIRIFATRCRWDLPVAISPSEAMEKRQT